MTMHAFQKHNIDHLSASSLNLWRESPGIWAVRYLANVKDDGNAAMWRGSAVENGMAAILRGEGGMDAVDLAHQSFDLNAQGEITDEIAAERDLIMQMVCQCTKWQPPGPLNATQLKVEHCLNDIPIPVIGYLDFAFDGLDVDLKTTKAIPSKPRPDHARQVALYRAARGRNGGVLYVSAKRYAYYPIDDETMEAALAELAADAQSLYQFLGRVNSAKDAMACLPIDREHFRYPKTKVPLSDVLLAG